MDFVSVDFELANRDFSSICEIGMVRFENGLPTAVFDRKVKQQEFDWYVTKNVLGYGASEVANEPALPYFWPVLAEWLDDNLIVCHADTEKRALVAAVEYHSLRPFGARWLNAITVFKKVWPDLTGYSVGTMAKHFGLVHRAHHGASDASMTGLLLTMALEQAGTTLAHYPIHPVFA